MYFSEVPSKIGVFLYGALDYIWMDCIKQWHMGYMVHWNIFEWIVFWIGIFAVSCIGLYSRGLKWMYGKVDFIKHWHICHMVHWCFCCILHWTMFMWIVMNVSALHQALAYLMYVALDCIWMNCIQNWRICMMGVFAVFCIGLYLNGLYFELAYLLYGALDCVWEDCIYDWRICCVLHSTVFEWSALDRIKHLYLHLHLHMLYFALDCIWVECIGLY